MTTGDGLILPINIILQFLLQGLRALFCVLCMLLTVQGQGENEL